MDIRSAWGGAERGGKDKGGQQTNAAHGGATDVAASGTHDRQEQRGRTRQRRDERRRRAGRTTRARATLTGGREGSGETVGGGGLQGEESGSRREPASAVKRPRREHRPEARRGIMRNASRTNTKERKGGGATGEQRVMGSRRTTARAEAAAWLAAGGEGGSDGRTKAMEEPTKKRGGLMQEWEVEYEKDLESD